MTIRPKITTRRGFVAASALALSPLASVFIDIIGRPLTPFSYAGVARRAYRRSFYWR
jgi:hypothetical protein